MSARPSPASPAVTPAGMLQRHRVRPEEMHGMAGQAGANHRLEHGRTGGRGALMDGRFLIWRSPSGVLVHANDGRELCDTNSTIDVPPRLNFMILFEGRLDFRFGGRSFQLDAPAGGTAPECAGMGTTRPEVLCRPLRAGRRLCKVGVTVGQDWLADRFRDGNGYREGYGILGCHLAHRRWAADPATVALARGLLDPPDYDPPLQRLHLESRAVELIGIALRALRHAPLPLTGDARPGRHDLRRLNRVLDFIEANLDRTPGLDETARVAGMSVSTLQRHFKRAFGESFLQYVRRRRLERARDALARNELTVGEAAYFAGYRHASNFVTAYRRAFGATPGSGRGRGP